MTEYMKKQMPNLIGILKGLGLSKETTTGICCLIKTESQMNQIVDLLYPQRYSITPTEVEQIALKVILGKI